MHYLFIISFELLGIGFHVMQVVSGLDKKHPDKKIPEIFAVFWDEDWKTVFINILVLAFDLLAHLAIDLYVPEVNKLVWFNVPIVLWYFVLAATLGYAGQRIVYKYLGKAEEALNKRADKIQ